jgi:hypothetical protein
MRIRKLVAGGLAAVAMAGSLAFAAPAGASSPTAPTLKQILDSQGGGFDRNWYDFDIIDAVVDKILAENPSSPLALAGNANSPVKLTVFLPNDRAFQALAADLLGFRYWFASETTVATALVTALPTSTLETVVQYHVIPNADIDSKTALSVPRGTPLTTLQGGQIRVTPVPFFGSAILSDNDRNDIDPFLIPSKLDIQASNGIAHGIAFVLRPADL